MNQAQVLAVLALAGSQRLALQAEGPLPMIMAGSGVRYLVGRAQQLPLEGGSVDVAVFMRSLHHVAPGDLMLALGEARRVLRPGGAVYVAEPSPAGDFFALTSLVEDELEVRQAAQNALERAALVGLDRRGTVDYDVRVCVRDLAGMLTPEGSRPLAAA